MKIYDLIYFDRLNEGVVIQTGQKRRRLFTVSIVLGVAGTFLIMAGNFLLGILGAGSLIVCLYGFFPSFASSVPAFFDMASGTEIQRAESSCISDSGRQVGYYGCADGHHIHDFHGYSYF